MKVSLIITTYNNPSALRKVTESILNQSMLPDEVIIADDGSDENTAHVVKRFSENASFPVLHVWQEDKGYRLAKIRNEAIKQTSGYYIIQIDGDCVLNRYFIADHTSLAERGCFIQGKRVLVGKDVVESFDHMHANSTSALIKMALTGKVSNFHHVIRIPYDISLKNRRLKGIKGCNMSFFYKDIVAVNGFNEDFVGWGSEDTDLACRFFKYGLIKKVHSSMAICFHLWHPTNKSLKGLNTEILHATMTSSEYFCKNGLVKKD